VAAVLGVAVVIIMMVSSFRGNDIERSSAAMVEVVPTNDAAVPRD